MVLRLHGGLAAPQAPEARKSSHPRHEKMRAVSGAAPRPTCSTLSITIVVVRLSSTADTKKASRPTPQSRRALRVLGDALPALIAAARGLKPPCCARRAGGWVG
jgi:hypothetical protein